MFNRVQSTNQDKHSQAINQFSHIEGSRIRQEYPAIDGLLYGLNHMVPPRYDNKTNHVPQDSYLSGYQKRPVIASAMRDNLVNAVVHELNNQGYEQREPIEHIVEKIAAGAAAIEEREYAYRNAGLLNPIYGSSDIVEHRYALAAKFLAQKQKQDDAGGGQRKQGDPDGMEYQEATGDPDSGHGEDDIEEFINHILRLEPYMPIISKYIDQCFGAPTERVRHTKVADEDGEKIEIVDFDFDNPSNITLDSLVTMAVPNAHYNAMMMDELTAEERYTELTKKYIDVFVVDQSSSMSSNQYIIRAAAYLYNRLEKVIKGWAMLSIVEFNTQAKIMTLPKELAGDDPAWMIDTPKKAQYMQQSIIERYLNFHGGGTNIPSGVYAGARLAIEMEKHGGILPNITVITDDDYSITECDHGQVKMPVNGVGVKYNQEMENYCIMTGGKYYHIDDISLNPKQILANLNGVR